MLSMSKKFCHWLKKNQVSPYLRRGQIDGAQTDDFRNSWVVLKCAETVTKINPLEEELVEIPSYSLAPVSSTWEVTSLLYHYYLSLTHIIVPGKKFFLIGIPFLYSQWVCLGVSTPPGDLTDRARLWLFKGGVPSSTASESFTSNRRQNYLQHQRQGKG